MLDGQIVPGSGATIRPQPDTPPQTLAGLQMRDGGPHVISASLATDDRLKVDDTRWRVVEVASELKVLIVEGERGIGAMAGSGAFLNLAACPPADAGSAAVPRGRNTSSYVAPELISDLELGNKVLSDYRALILCGVGQIQPSEADQIRTFVKSGGSLIVFMGEPVTADNYNPVLLPRKLMPGPLTKRVTSSSEQNGFNFDFQPRGVLHPLLGIFAGEEKCGLDTARVFTYWQVDLPAQNEVERVLNYLPAGASPTTSAATRPQAQTPADPAITMHALGQGRVIFISTTANDEWQSFCAKPSYLVLMHELLTGSVSTGDRWMNLLVGQPVEIPSSIKLTATPVLKDASQADVVMEQSRLAGGPSLYRSRPLLKPGIYTLTTGQRKIPIAVNVPDDEADIRTVDDAAITRAMGDSPMEFEGDQLPPISASQDASNDYGWSIMLIVLLLVGAGMLHGDAVWTLSEMNMIELKQLRLQYVTDASGHKVGVLMPLEQFNELMEEVEDLAAVAERREEPTISHQQLVEEAQGRWPPFRLSGKNRRKGSSGHCRRRWFSGSFVSLSSFQKNRFPPDR